MKRMPTWVVLCLLLVLLLPLIWSTVLYLKAAYTDSLTVPGGDIQALLKNVSYFAIGMLLLIDPEMILIAFSKRLRFDEKRRHFFALWFRLFGGFLVIGSLFSSHYLIGELLGLAGY